MDLENYTQVNIFKRTFEERQVANSHDMIEQPHNQYSAPIQHSFNPYQNNEGTVLGKFFFLLQDLSIYFPVLTKFFTFYSYCGTKLRDCRC